MLRRTEVMVTRAPEQEILVTVADERITVKIREHENPDTVVAIVREAQKLPRYGVTLRGKLAPERFSVSLKSQQGTLKVRYYIKEIV